MARGLSRAAIVEAALAVLDDGGIDAVTVRAVAARLGVRAPSLYHHVASKQELLDEMGTEVQRQVIAELRRRGDAGGSWTDDLAAYADALRAAYRAHRDGARTFSGTLTTDAEVLRAPEPWFRRWTEQGVDPARAFEAVELVTAFVVGFVIEEQERAQSEAGRYDAVSRAARVGEQAPFAVRSDPGRRAPDARFAAQLALLLAGVRAGGAA
jgi:TetR/AcrR family transcriptional regulator, tetracycline repressor protein